VEIGRVIGKHYLLQRLIKQGQYAVVYQGIDKAFQRIVAVKAVTSAHIPAYRASVRRTAQFTFSNLVGLYDLVIEEDRLYLVQEYIDGDDFAAIMQKPLQSHEVAEYGHQICLALLYAASSSRRTCHGDLTPSAIMCDRRGLIRVNNFALPSDVSYFSAWSDFGGVGVEGSALSDRDLPWGVESQGRRADDTRAVGLLLYQLLAGRPAGAGIVEPPADGRLRFRNNTPPELCDLVARTVIRNHPQHINSVEELNDELKILAVAPEPSVPVIGNIAANQAPQPAPAIQASEAAKPRQFAPAVAGRVPNTLSAGQPGIGHSAYRQTKSEKLVPATMETADSAAPTVADPSLMSAIARPARPSPDTEATPKIPGSSLILLLLLGLLLFAVCFAIGFYGGTLLGPH
jgi:serine/threonine protein kinase